MENVVTIERPDRYSELRKRVEKLETGHPVAAVSREQADSLRLVIERLEALDRLVAERTDF